MLPWTFTEPLHTQRLTLRLMDEGDVDAVFAYRSREDVCRYLPYPPQTRDQVATKVGEAAARVQLTVDGDYLTPAVVRREDGCLLGELHIRLASAEMRTAEIGWVFDPRHHGRGYATEAADELLSLGFERLGLHRIVAELAPENTASARVCARLGMRAEAHLVENVLMKGRWEDTAVYAVLRREWEQRR